MTFKTGDIISYIEMCQAEGTSLQKGMNYRLRNGRSVVLMSRRPDAPYRDEILEEGRVLIYEGHDARRRTGAKDPKLLDQPANWPSGKPTENQRFFEAAKCAASGQSGPELVRVYEKIRDGIWVYNGTFRLTEAGRVSSDGRRVFKFRLELCEEREAAASDAKLDLPQQRMIPSWVKLEVWKRDGGKCVKCGRADNLHFDHILPFSKGGSSLLPKNVQLLCARHNLAKRDRIE